MAAGLMVTSAANADDVNTWDGLKSGLTTTGGDFTATGNISDANAVVSGKTSSLNLSGLSVRKDLTIYQKDQILLK